LNKKIIISFFDNNNVQRHALMENEKGKDKQKVAIGAMHLHNTN